MHYEEQTETLCVCTHACIEEAWIHYEEQAETLSVCVYVHLLLHMQWGRL